MYLLPAQKLWDTLSKIRGMYRLAVKVNQPVSKSCWAVLSSFMFGILTSYEVLSSSLESDAFVYMFTILSWMIG